MDGDLELALASYLIGVLLGIAIGVIVIAPAVDEHKRRKEYETERDRTLLIIGVRDAIQHVTEERNKNA